MKEFLQKLTSRKFILAAATFLIGVGTGLAGFVIGEYDLTKTGALMIIVGTAAYNAAEGYHDGKRAASNTTSTNTNVNASANNADIVKDVISNK